jgi:hypothetical protein
MAEDKGCLTEEERALDERVRQAELLISAQATFLAATYHRATVLAGLVFGLAVALLGLTYTDLVDPLIIELTRRLGLLALAPLILLVFTTALAKADLPGAIDSRKGRVTADQLKEALLEGYRQSARWNNVRLAISRYAVASVALTMFIIGTLLYREVRDLRSFERALAAPELAAQAWDDQSEGVRRAFRQIQPGRTEEEWEATWNRLKPDQRRAVLIHAAQQIFREAPDRNESAPDTLPE